MEGSEAGPTVKQNIAQIEEMISFAQVVLREYKKLAETLRSEQAAMESKIRLAIADTPKSIQPQIDELTSDLRQAVQSQQAQNESLQKQITGLKKEKFALEQNINSCNFQAEKLETTIGILRKS